MANEYLRRTPTSTGNRRIFTWSGWIKKEAQSTNATIFEATLSGEYRRNLLTFYQGNLYYGAENSSATTVILVGSSALFRDNNSWYHIIWSIDTTALQLQDRVRIYVNGVQARLNFTTTTNLSINTLQGINATGEHNIGRIPAAPGAEQFSGYLADVFFIDGQALTPDVFGFNKPGKGYISVGSTQATDFRPGQWVPKKPRVIITEINRRGGFGVNGFYLPMNDSNNFGADFHCTPNSIIKLQENLPQPRCRIDGVGDYTGSLRDDPFKQYLVLALPFVSGGLQSGLGDYSAAVRGSGTPKTITVNNVSIGNTASYYGSAGNFTSSSSSYITTPRNVSDYNMESGDFTVEGWVYFKSINTGQYTRFFSIGNTSNEGIVWELNISTSTLTFCTTIGADYNAITTPFAIVANQWYHIAQVRKGTTYSAYVNGVCVGIDTTTSGAVNFNSNTALVIGAWESPIGSYTRFTDCYIQDLRIYKGVAKYTGGFDVPRPYTPVGISTWRAVPDTTANNFATLNPLSSNGLTLSGGNLDASISGSNDRSANATVGIPTSGKWYFEVRQNSTSGGIYLLYTGIRDLSTSYNAMIYPRTGNTCFYINSTANCITETNIAGDVWAVAVNMDSGVVDFYKNGVLYSGQSKTITLGIQYFPFLAFGNVGQTGSINFGQNPTFSGNTTAGTFTDSNGKGLFKYQPPAGFLALCEDNLPTPTISDPGKHFKTVLYTGSGTYPRNIVGIGFTPDLVWIKDRSATTFHRLYNSVSGPLRGLYSNATNAETAENIQSFDADGFTLNTDSYGGGINNSGNNHVAWCWRAGAGTTSTNTDGSITSVISVNRDSGFSIVSFTMTSGTQTIGHGLGKTPKFIITKQRDGSYGWWTYHESIGQSYLDLSSTNASASLTWGGTNTPSVFYINNSYALSGQRVIAFCWAEIEGFSKFGSYVGNGSADGPFVYCGFKPAFVMTKNTATGTNWLLWDNARTSTNPNSNYQIPNNALIDQTSGADVDFLSNGFKIRNTSASGNGSGNTIIFAAFAESPFTTANSK